MPATFTCAPEASNATRAITRYDVDDRFSMARATGDGVVDVWCPLIPDTPYQRVLSVAVDTPTAWTVGHEREHGNSVLHARLSGALSRDLSFRLRYSIERRPVGHMLDPRCARPLDTPALFQRWLRAERFVDVDEATRALAREVIGPSTNVLEQARQIYEHVAGAMAYDAQQQSWKGSTQHALTCSVGNCNDIHALFISLCRSVGIPARLVMGQAFEPPPPGQETCEVCGYHCWAEFFASGLGWVPVDASCACKYGKDHLFGDLEMNHIAWSTGRDIQLEPAQGGDRLLFFVGPYVEVDGTPYSAIERRIVFTEIRSLSD